MSSEHGLSNFNLTRENDLRLALGWAFYLVHFEQDRETARRILRLVQGSRFAWDASEDELLEWLEQLEVAPMGSTPRATWASRAAS